MVIREKAGKKPVEHTIIPGQEAIYITKDASRTLHAKPLGSLRRDQLIPVNKAVNEKEQLEKRTGGGGKKSSNGRKFAQSCHPALSLYPQLSVSFPRDSCFH
jgi:hypothetical protein